MKIIAFEVANHEEEYFNALNKQIEVDITCIKEIATLDNIEKAKGYKAVTILGHSKCGKEMIDKLHELGVQFLSTRTIGTDHIDVAYARSKGMKVTHSGYAPDGVSDYTIMLMLMSLRHYKQAMFRGNVNDYSLVGLQGKELHSQCIGVIGTGKVGQRVIESLQGFNPRIIAYDKFVNKEIEDKVEYVSLERLLEESDIITLHTPLLDSTRHMINADAFHRMKDGVVIINTARGELINTNDLIDAVESKKVGAVGLDVIENESGIYHMDRKIDIIENRNMAYLRQFPNVVMTQHIAFFTEEAIQSMVEISIDSLLSLENTGTSIYEVS